MTTLDYTRRKFVKVLLLGMAVSMIPLGPACTEKGLSKANKIDFSAIKSPIILKGDETTAYRDPACIYHNGVFRLFYTYNLTEDDGKTYWVTAFSKSRDLIHWTKPKIITPIDRNLNFASPGNVIGLNIRLHY